MGMLRFPESVTEPEEVVMKGREVGLNVLCITDHNSVLGAHKARDHARKVGGIEVVVGEEVSTADGEVIALFIEERIPEGLSIEETIERVREQGGLTIAPHPYSLHCPCLKDRIFDLDLDGIEVLNGGHIDDYANNKAKEVGASGRWALMGGSDAHYIRTVGFAHTLFEGSTAEDLRRSILQKSTVPEGEPTSLLLGIAWSIKVVIRSDHLIMRSILGLNKGYDPDDPIISRIEHMRPDQKLAAFVGSFIFLLPPVPFLLGMTGKQRFRTLEKELRNERKT